MKLFIILFILALLFVIGSAGMMKYFDRKHLPPPQKSPSDKKPDDTASN